MDWQVEDDADQHPAFNLTIMLRTHEIVPSPLFSCQRLLTVDEKQSTRAADRRKSYLIIRRGIQGTQSRVTTAYQGNIANRVGGF